MRAIPRVVSAFPHLTTEMFKMRAGIDIVHVPYKGTPPAVTDLIAGQVSMMFADTLSVLPQVKAGQSPDLRERLAAQGAEALGGTPEQVGIFIRSEIAKWGKVVRDSGARAD